VLFYSWSEVRAYDTFADGIVDSEQRERTRALVREVFDFAESSACRHVTLANRFGESLSDCGRSCDNCSGQDLLREATPKHRRARQAMEHPSAVPVSRPPLFEALRDLRRQLASERGIPAYVIFNDKTLLEMALTRPTDPDALLAIPGVGPTKLERYGEAFLAVLQGTPSPPSPQ
jgi:ATP-dependent DNA helicase RecQ